MFEVLNYYKPRIQDSDVLNRMQLESGRYFIVSAHREENVDSGVNLRDLLDTLNALAETYDLPVIVSTHPRTRERLDALQQKELDRRVKFMEPFGFCDYVRLQMESLCVISDSGTITEEASILNLPAITIRNTHERPEGMDCGTLILAGLERERVLEAVRITISQHDRQKATVLPVPDYDNPSVSKQVLRIVQSYTDYVNRTVWRKCT